MRIFFTTLLIATLLYAVVDFFDRIDAFFEHATSAWTVIRYLIFSAPLAISHVMGFAALFSTLFCLSMAVRANEITAIRASGTSIRRIAMPLLIMSIFICVGNVFWNETLLPIFTHKAQTIYWTEIRQKQQQTLLGTHDIWIREKGSFINIQNFEPRTKQLDQVTLLLLNPDFSLREIIEIRSARWDSHRLGGQKVNRLAHFGRRPNGQS